MRSNTLELSSGRKSNFRRSKQLMLAAEEPKINLLSKCVPSVLVLGRIVFRSEHAIRTYFCFNISVGSFCQFQPSFLHMFLPIPRKTPVTSAWLTWKLATCPGITTYVFTQSILSGHLLRLWLSFASLLRDTHSLWFLLLSSPFSLCSAHSYWIFHCQPTVFYGTC